MRGSQGPLSLESVVLSGTVLPAAAEDPCPSRSLGVVSLSGLRVCTNFTSPVLETREDVLFFLGGPLCHRVWAFPVLLRHQSLTEMLASQRSARLLRLSVGEHRPLARRPGEERLNPVQSASYWGDASVSLNWASSVSSLGQIEWCCHAYLLVGVLNDKLQSLSKN